MIILKTLLSGGSTTPLLSEANREIKTPNLDAEGVTKQSTTTTEEREIKPKKMEFMYCIPDLEVFIDKTIKKCLLEYDLDANDTEAVLDDMEKAWPKSPPRSSDKQVLKDFNDNTDKRRSGRPPPTVHQFQEGVVLDEALDKSVLKNGDASMQLEKSRGVDSPAHSDNLTAKEEGRGGPLSNGNREAGLRLEEGVRSGSSSPDVGEGKNQTRAHPKLKSRLQQRYFEGKQNPEDSSAQVRSSSSGSSSSSNNNHHHHIDDETWGPNRQASSNLDLLASAANIHTETSRRNEEQRLEAIRRFQEDSVRKFHEDIARQAAAPTQKSFQNGLSASTTLLNGHAPASTSSALNGLGRATSVTLNPSHVPHLVKLMSAKPCSSSSSSSSSSASTSLHYHDGGVLNGSNINSNLRMTGTMSSHSVTLSASRGDARPLTTVASGMKPEDERIISFVDRERAQVLLQHYQNGYHALIPRETVVVRRELPREEEDVGIGRPLHPSAALAASPWNIVNDKATTGSQYRNLSPSSRYNTPHPSPQQPEIYHEPFQRYGSRIATIIAEELQKDNDSKRDNSNNQNISSIDRIIPPEMKPQASQEPVRVRQLYPALSRRAASSELSYRPPQAQPEAQSDMYHVISGHESAVSHSRPARPLLPAHIFPENGHLGSTNLPSHLRHNPALTTGRVEMYGASSGVIDDEQPQDLSTKSRMKPSENISEREGQYFSSSNPDSPVTDKGTRGYFSSPSSPVANVPVSLVESSAFRKSVSPSNSSDKECDYNSGRDGGSNLLRTSGKWERKGQVHGIDTLPTGAKDSKILAEKRRMEALKRWSDARDGEVSKRRDIH